MNVQREARRDAKEYARAQMFYGEGAGTRRKLITNAVAAKTERKPGYQAAFHRELARQDMSEHAKKARHERDRKDVKEAVGKNVRGIATGNYRSVNTALMVVIIGAYYAHATGLDKKAYTKSKTFVNDVRSRIRHKKVIKGLLIDLNIPRS